MREFKIGLYEKKIFTVDFIITFNFIVLYRKFIFSGK